MKKSVRKRINKIQAFYEGIRIDLAMFLATVIGTFLYTVGIVWFLDSNRLFSGGLIGMSQITTAIFEFLDIDVKLNFGVINFLFNVPLLVLAFVKLNRRYAIYTTLSIILQTIIIVFTPLGKVDNIAWVFSNFIGIDKVNGAYRIMDMGKVLSAAIVGGGFLGVGTGIAMKYGTSTGGLDVFAQYYSFKSDKSVGGFFLIFNGIIILIAFITLSPELAVFTMIRQVVSTLCLDKVHTSYNYVSLDVISPKSDEIAQQILAITGRGATKTRTVGAYSNKETTKLNIVCSSYEISDILDTIYAIDERAFTTSTNVARLYGRFNKKLIGSGN